MREGLPDPPFSNLAMAADARTLEHPWLLIPDHGIYQSDSGGAAWTRTEPNLASNFTGHLVVLGSTLWLAPGKYTARSSDGGRTWSYLPHEDTPIVAQDASSGRLYLWGPYPRYPLLWYSTDGGTTRSPSERGIHGSSATTFVDAAGRLYARILERVLRWDRVGDRWHDITPQRPGGDPAFCSSFAQNLSATGLGLAVGGTELVRHSPTHLRRSSDGGSTWLEATGGASGCLFAVRPDDPSAMYGRSDILLRVGNGSVASGTLLSKTTGGAMTQPPFAFTRALIPTGGSRLIARGDRSIATSSDDGASWSHKPWTVHDVAVGAGLANVVLLVAEEGVDRSDDGGATFVRTSALPDSGVRHVAQDPLNDRVGYAITVDGRVFESADGGVTWAPRGGVLDPAVAISNVAISAWLPHRRCTQEQRKGCLLCIRGTTSARSRNSTSQRLITSS